MSPADEVAADDPAGSGPGSGSGGPAVALVVCREGRLPAGADECVAEAGGQAVLLGSGAREAAAALASATQVWWSEIEAGPGGLASRLAPLLDPVDLVILPASPDGRDLAPRLAATMGRPLLAGAVAVQARAGAVWAQLLRVDGRVMVPVTSPGPAVVTMLPGVRAPAPAGSPPRHQHLDLEDGQQACQVDPAGAGVDGGRHRAERIEPEVVALVEPEVVALVEPDPATMDLADATRVLGGGAGLVPHGATDAEARAIFRLLGEVAASLGASMGATRVVTDAGWTAPERQIGTTGVAVHPELYVALGVSGASQHTAGLGAPRHVVSVNTDPSCPMTALADLGLVTDAHALLVRLAQHLGVAVPEEPDRKEPDGEEPDREETGSVA